MGWRQRQLRVGYKPGLSGVKKKKNFYWFLLLCKRLSVSPQWNHWTPQRIMYKAVTASPVCTKAVSASIKTGRDEMLSGMTLCLICSSLIHGLTRRNGNVRINAFLEDVRRIWGLACNFRAVYVKSNEINLTMLSICVSTYSNYSLSFTARREKKICAAPSWLEQLRWCLCITHKYSNKV